MIRPCHALSLHEKNRLHQHSPKVMVKCVEGGLAEIGYCEQFSSQALLAKKYVNVACSLFPGFGTLFHEGVPFFVNSWKYFHKKGSLSQLSTNFEIFPVLRLQHLFLTPSQAAWKLA
jgi:hypothetical protein